MEASAVDRFYRNLYWGQHRHIDSRLVRRTNLTLLCLSLLLSAGLYKLLWLYREIPEVLHDSLPFKIMTGLGIFIWLQLLILLCFPRIYVNLMEKIFQSGSSNSLCRAIALNEPVSNYERLLNDPKVMNKKDDLGKTPLFYLCRTNKVDLVRKIVGTNSALINQTDDLGETPFIEALRAGHIDLINHFLELKPVYSNGYTPIMASAATKSLQDFVTELLGTGDQVKKISNDKTSCALIAARAGQFDNLDRILQDTGSVHADKYGDHPLDWIIAAKEQASIEKMATTCNKDQFEHLDSTNSSFLHKSVMADWPYGTQFIFRLFQNLADIKNTERKTPLALAQADTKLKAHENILLSSPNHSGSTVQTPAGNSSGSRNASASKSRSTNSNTGSLDFDLLAARLEQAFSEVPQAKSLPNILAQDLEEFYNGSRARIQLWTGTANTGKKTTAHRFLKTISHGDYSGVFFPAREIGYEAAADPVNFFKSFFDQKKYPDNSIIVIEDAENLLDPTDNLVTGPNHTIILKQLDRLNDERKLFFVFVGDFAKRSGPPMSLADRKDIFGSALAPFISMRYFHPPDVLAFIAILIDAYHEQKVRLDDDAFLRLAQYCVKEGVNKEAFFVFLKEIQNTYQSREGTIYTDAQVQKFLESR